MEGPEVIQELMKKKLIIQGSKNPSIRLSFSIFFKF